MLDALRRRIALMICPELAPRPFESSRKVAGRKPMKAHGKGAMTTQQLLRLAEIFAAHGGLTLATVGTYAGNAGHFFKGLSEGSTCTVRKAERVARWFSDHWPADLPWPADIPRPPKTTMEAA